MRKALSMVLAAAFDHGQKVQQDKRSGQLGLFGDSAETTLSEPELPPDEWTEAEMLAREKAALGFYVTRHPLAASAKLIEACATHSTVDLSAIPDGADVVLGGMVSGMRTITTRNNKRMGIVTLEDLKGSIEAVVFADNLPAFRPLLAPDSIVFLRGQVDRRREEPSLRVAEVIPAAEAPFALADQVWLDVPDRPDTEQVLVKLKERLQAHPGDRSVYLRFHAGDELSAVVRCSGGLGIGLSNDFTHEVSQLLGPGSVCLLSRTRRSIPLDAVNGRSLTKAAVEPAALPAAAT
jgi:DNA polymerase-3 subunit alpha